MRNLNVHELNLIMGAGIDKDAAVAIGSAIGGGLGNASKIPGASIIGGSLGGYVGGVIADGSNNTITIPPVNINTNPGIGLGSFNPNYNPGLMGSGSSWSGGASGPGGGS
ncbi:hypothetical protein ACQR7C_26770 (plasmid) [Salmonella enterica]|uniref:hypothetical protein n=1 Tax=Salmonella enterica TaxID=28901 RepID=UPI003D2F0BB9